MCAWKKLCKAPLISVGFLVRPSSVTPNVLNDHQDQMLVSITRRCSAHYPCIHSVSGRRATGHGLILAVDSLPFSKFFLRSYMNKHA